MTPKVGDIWYRYEDRLYSTVIDADREVFGSRMVVEESTYWVEKVTPKGVWLSRRYSNDPHRPKDIFEKNAQGQYRWMLAPRFQLLSANKKFAAPTVALAVESYVARKSRQISIHQAAVDRAKRAVEIITHYRGEKPENPAEATGLRAFRFWHADFQPAVGMKHEL